MICDLCGCDFDVQHGVMQETMLTFVLALECVLSNALNCNI